MRVSSPLSSVVPSPRAGPRSADFPPACHAPPGRVAVAAALLGFHPGPVRPVQVPGEHGRGLGVGALRMPAQSGVHEGLHADQGGPARNHVRKPAREVLHSGKLIVWHFGLNPESALYCFLAKPEN